MQLCSEVIWMFAGKSVIKTISKSNYGIFNIINNDYIKLNEELLEHINFAYVTQSNLELMWSYFNRKPITCCF